MSATRCVRHVLTTVYYTRFPPKSNPLGKSKATSSPISSMELSATSALFRLVCAMTMSAAYRSHSCSHRLDCSGVPRGTMAQVLPTKRLVAMETFASTWDNLFAAAVCRELLWRKTFAAVGKECGAASDGAQHHQRPRILISLRLLIGATITRKNGAAQSRAA